MKRAFLTIILGLGILNGAIGLVQMYRYLNGDNGRQKLAIVMLNVTVFAFSLVYVSIRRERLNQLGNVTASRVSR